MNDPRDRVDRVQQVPASGLGAERPRSSLRSWALRFRWGILAMLGCLALLVASLRPLAQPATHSLYSRGQCGQCHEAAPTYHDGVGWMLKHGRTEDAHVGRCIACHARAACLDCHAKAPPSHTSEFRSPQARGSAQAQHVYVGRSRPSACIVCHRRAAQDCGPCHALGEIDRWLGPARQSLSRWDGVLEVAP